MAKKVKTEYFGFADDNIDHHRVLSEIFERGRATEQTETTPVIIENKNRNWVSFGKNNLYPQEIMQLKHQSALHDTILEQKTKFIAGEGFGEDSQPFIGDIFGDEAADHLWRMALDLDIFGGYYLHVLYKLGGTIDRVWVIPYQDVRTGKLVKQRDGTLKIEKFYISHDWARHRKRNFIPIEIPAFNPNRVDRESLKKGQVVQVKRYEAWQGQRWYSLPDYLGAINDIRVSSMIPQFHVANLENNMSPSVHIHVPGDFSDSDRRKALKESIKVNHTDVKKAGEPILTWSDSEHGQVKVTPLPSSGNHEMFLMLNQMVSLNLTTAHKMPPSLVGLDGLIKTGMDGKSLAIKESLQMFQNTVVMPLQRKIEKSIQVLADVQGFNEDIKINNLVPFNFSLSDDLRMHVESINEIREDAGRDEREGGEKTPKENEQNIITE